MTTIRLYFSIFFRGKKRHVDTGKLQNLPVEQGDPMVTDLQFNSDGQSMVTVSSRTALKVTDTTSGVVRFLRLPEGTNQLLVNADASRLVTREENDSGDPEAYYVLRVWDISSGRSTILSTTPSFVANAMVSRLNQRLINVMTGTPKR